MKRACLFIALAAAAVRADALELLDATRAAALTQTSTPRIVALWSLDCAYCDGNLRKLAALARERTFDFVAVATDAPERRADVEARLASLALGDAATWLYGEASPERLNYRIDADWGGELPRTIIIGAGERLGLSGALTDAQIDRLRGQLPPRK